MADFGRKGDWAQVLQVVLPPGERAPQVPPDTASVPLELRAKGFLAGDARIGETATVITLTGRQVSGTLTAVNPRYGHDFGSPVPELLTIGQELREMLFSAKAQGSGAVRSPGAPEGGKPQ